MEELYVERRHDSCVEEYSEWMMLRFSAGVGFIVLTALLFESCDCFITEVIKTQRGRLRSVLQRSTSDEKYYTVDEVAEAKFDKSRNSANRGDNGKSSARRRGYQGSDSTKSQQSWSRDKSSNGNRGKGSRGRGYVSVGEKHRQVDRILAACRGDVSSTAANSYDNKKGGQRPKANNAGPSKSTKSVSLTEVNHAIVTAGRLHRIDDALEIFNAVNGYKPKAKRSSGGSVSSSQSFEFGPDLMTFNNIIWCAGNAGKFDLAKSLFTQLLNDDREKKLSPNVYTYGSLMHGCVKAKAYRQALDYLDKMEEHDITPNQIVFTSAMEACAESGQYKEATGVMDRMISLGMKPDLTMVNAAIKACSLAGAMDDAEALAQTLREYGAMDVFTYHTLMMGNTKLARHHNVLSLYEEALSSTAQLDGGVYSLAMLAALNSGLYQQVPRIAERARSEEVALTEASYTILIQALAEAGASNEAVICLDTMISEGLTPNVISYAAATAASRDKPEVVIDLLERMRSANVAPNTVVLTSAINSLARAGGDFTYKAYAILQDMEANGPEPNIYTYNTVTRAFAEAGKLDEALDLLKRIKSRNLKPDRFTFTTLLLCAGRHAASVDNSVCVDDKSQREISSDTVSDIMVQMKVAGVVADEIAYGAAIDAHRRANNSLKAVECLHDMYRTGLEPAASHYNLVLRTMRAEGYIDKMYRMVVDICKKEGAKINGNTFELVIEALLEIDQWKEALSTLSLMEDMQFKPSLAVYVTLVEKLEKAKQFKAVMTLYRAMVRDGYDFYENTVLNSIFKKIVSIRLSMTEDDAVDDSPVSEAELMRRRQRANRNRVNRKADKSIRDNFSQMRDSDMASSDPDNEDEYGGYDFDEDEEEFHDEYDVEDSPPLLGLEVPTTAVLNELNNI